MKYLYGPVQSRRLGMSLGIDLVPFKTCSHNCIYCQCGLTTNKTTQRDAYVRVNEVIHEVKDFLSTYKGKVDYLTLSGAGDPTLNSGLGEVIRQLKQMSKFPVAVLTNSSLLWQEEVQTELMAADLVVPTLNAVLPESYEAINRPVSKDINQIIDGLVKFRGQFKGKFWLEIVLVRLYNDDQPNLDALKKAIERIKPDQVHLNTVSRPPAEDFAYPVAPEEMKKVADFLGAEIVVEQAMEVPQEPGGGDPKTCIMSLLSRRPCTIPEIINSLGLDEEQAAQDITDLENDKKIRYTVINSQIYYHLRRDKT